MVSTLHILIPLIIFTFKNFASKFFILLTNRLEDTFIDLYLFGYKNIQVSGVDAMIVHLKQMIFFLNIDAYILLNIGLWY